jgi:hypothetical protein
MTKKNDRHFLEAALQNIEAAIDTAVQNDAIAAIPVVGTAFKVLRGIDEFRSRVFAAKLAKFVSEPYLQTDEAKRNIKQKVAESPDKANKVGETLFLVLDRFIDIDKPTILSKVFVAYLDNIVSADELQRLAQAIDLAFGDDLKELLAAEDLRFDDDFRPWIGALANSGLTISRVKPIGPAKTFYQVTPLGQTLWKAWRHAPK